MESKAVGGFRARIFPPGGVTELIPKVNAAIESERRDELDPTEANET